MSQVILPQSRREEERRDGEEDSSSSGSDSSSDGSDSSSSGSESSDEESSSSSETETESRSTASGVTATSTTTATKTAESSSVTGTTTTKTEQMVEPDRPMPVPAGGQFGTASVRRSVSFAQNVQDPPPKSTSSPSKSSGSTGSSKSESSRSSGSSTGSSRSSGSSTGSDEESSSSDESSESDSGSDESSSVSVSASTNSAASPRRDTAEEIQVTQPPRVASGKFNVAPPQATVSQAPPQVTIPISQADPALTKAPSQGSLKPPKSPSGTSASTDSTSSSGSTGSSSSSSSSSSTASSSTKASTSASSHAQTSTTGTTTTTTASSATPKPAPPRKASAPKLSAEPPKPIPEPPAAAAESLDRRSSRRDVKTLAAQPQTPPTLLPSPTSTAAHKDKDDDVVRTEDDANTPPPSVKNSIEGAAALQEKKPSMVVKPSTETFDTPQATSISPPQQPSEPKESRKGAPTATDSAPIVRAPSDVKRPSGKPVDEGNAPLRYSTSVRESIESTSSTVSGATESSTSSDSSTTVSSRRDAKSTTRPAAAAKEERKASPPPDPIQVRVVRERVTLDFTEALPSALPLPECCFVKYEDDNVVTLLWNRLTQGRRQETEKPMINREQLGYALRAIGLTEHQIATLLFGNTTQIDQMKFVELIEYQLRAVFRTEFETLFRNHDPTRGGELSWAALIHVLRLAGVGQCSIAGELELDIAAEDRLKAVSVQCVFLGSEQGKAPVFLSLDQNKLDVKVVEPRTVMVQGGPLCALSSEQRCSQVVQGLEVLSFIGQAARQAVFAGESLVDYQLVMETLCGLTPPARAHLLAHRFVNARYRPADRMAAYGFPAAAPGGQPLPPSIGASTLAKSFLADSFLNRAVRRSYLAPEAEKSGTAFVAAANFPQNNEADSYTTWCLRPQQLSVPRVSSTINIKRKYILVSVIDKASKVLPPIQLECGTQNTPDGWSLLGDKDFIVRGQKEDILYFEFCLETDRAEQLSAGFAAAQLKELEEGTSHLWVNGGTFWKRTPSKETSSKSCCTSGPPASRFTIVADKSIPADVPLRLFPQRFLCANRHLGVLSVFRKAVFDYCASAQNCQMALSTASAQQAIRAVEDPILFELLCKKWDARYRGFTPEQKQDKDSFVPQQLLSLISTTLAAWLASSGKVDAVEAVLAGGRVPVS